MFKPLIGFLALIFIYSCNTSTNPTTIDYVILSGKITDPNSDSLVLMGSKREKIHKITLSKENTFSDTISLKTGYYSLFDGTELAYVFLKPSFSLYITLDTKEFDESIKFEGAGAMENNYLAQKNLLSERLEKVNNYNYYGRLDEEPFLKLTDSICTLNMELLKKHKIADSLFYVLEEKKIILDKADKLSNYEGMHSYLTNNPDFDLSKNFPDPYTGINLNDETLLEVDMFLPLLNSYYSKVHSQKFESKSDTFDYSISYIRFLNTYVSSALIKEELLFNTAKNMLKGSKNMDLFHSEYLKIASNDIHKKEITRQFEVLKKIAKGNPSPSFAFPDLAGKIVSLEQLKGKFVYIDVWATWCGPCKKEIPDLKKLEKEFRSKNIAFVSICCWDEKENWEKMVKEEELDGIQLFVEDKESSFLSDYMIEGIPRFILLDTEGKIINSDADRPSNPDLKNTLSQLVK